MRKYFVALAVVLSATSATAQFHTLKIPHPSNHVVETQRLGVTDITMDYSSPRVRNRDVWRDEIPQNGNPIAWRAGANLNTTIEFSTDVMIEGKPLAAGKYGFHIIPRADRYTLLFAHSNHLWGSYYLDIENDITLSVDVQSKPCTFSEKLDFEFDYLSDDAMVIGLEWADKRIPFTVSVDLNETVLTSFRSELRGLNTNRWESWHDAANWCLQRNINLEEALTWVNRSIEGGYGGFAANKNMTNMMTKARIEQRMNREEAMQATLEETVSLVANANDYHSVIRMMMQTGQYQKAFDTNEDAQSKYPDVWFLELNKGLAYYFLGKKKQAIKAITKAQTTGPESLKARFDQVKSDMEAGTYQLPQG